MRPRSPRAGGGAGPDGDERLGPDELVADGCRGGHVAAGVSDRSAHPTRVCLHRSTVRPGQSIVQSASALVLALPESLDTCWVLLSADLNRELSRGAAHPLRR